MTDINTLENPVLKNIARRVMLFELDTRGHHPGYIRLLVDYWSSNAIHGHLSVVVTQKFLQEHGDIVQLAQASPHGNIEFIALHPSEEVSLFESAMLEISFKGRILRAFQEWNLLGTYAKRLKSDIVLLMCFDVILLRFALGGTLPCPVSAIYFRPLLHYSQFPNFKPQGRESLWQWRDRICLSLLLRHPNLKTLFCLDEFAADYINRSYFTNKARLLPDPACLYSPDPQRVKALKTRLQLEDGRLVFLLFGVLSDRKGAYQVLDAMCLLPKELSSQITVLVVGSGTSEEKTKLEAYIQAARPKTDAHLVLHAAFVDEKDVASYFELADVVLAPYQRHIGMSGVLVLAAAAQKPVLSSDFGLMGEVVRRHQLGLTVDSTCSSSLAEGFVEFLRESPCNIGDRTKMAQFSTQNTYLEFSKTIFKDLGVLD